jgi:hypothetical protein
MRCTGKVIGALVAVVFVSAPVLARASAVEPLAPPGGPPAGVGSLTYVKDLDHLAAITSPDSALHLRTVELERKGNIGMGVLMGSAALGALIVVGAATVFTQEECIGASPPLCQSRPNGALAGVGLFTMVAGGLAGLMIMPHRGDLLDIVNEWNARHPEQTLLLDSPHRLH